MRQGLNGNPFRRSHLGLLAPCIAAALALVAPRAMGQCTLSLSSAVNFGAGNAPGAPKPAAFVAGYENDVSVYTSSSGTRRLLLMFNYGYGVMDLSNPASPTALAYADMRSDIPPRGDGQNYVWSMGVAPDGARAVFSLGPQGTPFKAAVGTALGASQSFFLKGDFSAGAATATVVQKTGDGRYIAYALTNKLVAANITTLPTGLLTAGSIPSELSAFPSGASLQLAGNYLSYLSGTSVLILNASNPGSSPPNITAGFTETTLSMADFGRSSGYPVSLATALDPADPSALYILVEFTGSTPIYCLMRVQGGTKTLLGSFPIPPVAGETWSPGSSALITGGSNVYVFMWASRVLPSMLFRLYSTTVSSFGSAAGAIDFDPGVYSLFSAQGYPMRGFASADGTVNAYMGTGQTAYALTFACASVTASNDGPVCAGTPLTLTSTGPASATYAWSGPNGFTAAVQNPTIATPTAAASGVYQVTRTYLGTDTTAQTTATVNPPPTAPAAGNNGPLCAGGTLALTVSTISNATYSWTGPNGFTSALQNPTIPNATAAADGDYSVTATVNGCTGPSGTTSVTVNPAPAPHITAPASALPGTAGLTASVLLHAGSSYLWGITNGTITAGAGTNQITFTAGPSGVTVLTVVETTIATGCASPATSANVYINAEPAGLVEDAHATAGTISNVNNILEPGETVLVNPSWKNVTASLLALTGTASAFTGPAGATYSLLDSSAGYGTIAPGATADSFSAGGPSYRLSVSNPVTRPAAHWDATFLETLSNGIAKTWTLHVGSSFTDVPVSDGAYRFAETLLHNGISAGCGGGNYCPAGNVTRWQMAVFLATGMTGPSGTVPASGTVPSVGSYDCAVGGLSFFGDVPPTDPGCPFIHYIYSQGLTTGCGGGNYCPATNVTRWQMAVMLATGMVGPSGTVPASGTVPSVGSYNCTSGGTSLFGDILPTDPGCRFIHYIYVNGVTAGCGGGNYCPASNVTRWQMAPFLVTAFKIPFLY